jgi:hypothetical protein
VTTDEFFARLGPLKGQFETGHFGLVRHKNLRDSCGYPLCPIEVLRDHLGTTSEDEPLSNDDAAAHAASEFDLPLQEAFAIVRAADDECLDGNESYRHRLLEAVGLEN